MWVRGRTAERMRGDPSHGGRSRDFAILAQAGTDENAALRLESDRGGRDGDFATFAEARVDENAALRHAFGITLSFMIVSPLVQTTMTARQ